MSVLAAWLVAVGAGDLARALARGPERDGRPWGIGVGLGVLVATAALAGLVTPADLALVALAAGGLAGWVLTSQHALAAVRGELTALAVLAGTGVLLVLLSGWASPAGGLLTHWLAWTGLTGADPPVGRLLLVTGLLLVQTATGNAVVRLVLTRMGTLRPEDGRAQASDRLRGGRLLGAMERVVILGLGLAGEVTAASLVIAAKGLLRFPELQGARAWAAAPVWRHPRSGSAGRVARRAAALRVRREEGRPGIDEITEYFLVGSFVSWLLALASLALSRLG